ncbi:hypothetical protein CJ030_MR2G025681 [Morella rubra]|uniref:Uncharacterized protein n=1 Tax=Morella rubra TaxID=262757 RepID=A0A6A1UQU7_9ROSI|nr:hypothetical protein CJ030_MR8G020245 [Morella rubra]KAB1223392.1 hypothetical protein CJ030_MR2G025681 [Morella rubra]
MTRKRFRTISSSSQPPVPPSQEATASQEATPSQPPAHPSEQATMPSFDYDQSLNDNEIIGRHRSHAGKQNRSLQTTVHTAGSKSFARYAHELRRMEEIGLNDSGSSQTSNEFRVDGSIGWSPSDRYAQVIGPERHGRIRGVGLGPTPSSHPANTNEQRQYQDVPNNNQVSPAIHRSSHASRKTSVADNADDAESAGADGAEGGED